jgi:hypothetical protein
MHKWLLLLVLHKWLLHHHWLLLLQRLELQDAVGRYKQAFWVVGSGLNVPCSAGSGN